MKIEKTLSPGSHCLYYKVYCAVSYSDTFLTKELGPILEELIRDRKIESWFFIRYKDTAEHLRIRIFTLEYAKHEVWSLLGEFFGNAQEKSTIKDVAMGTYRRELTRYGESRILDVERLWSYETSLLTKALGDLKDGDYLIFCILLANRYLSVFYKCEENLNERIMFHINSFYEEFGITSKGRKQIGLKFKTIAKKLEIYSRNEDSFTDYILINTKILELVKKINDSLKQEEKDRVVSSILHMFFNRCFYSNQRMMEMVCYHHLNSMRKMLKAKYE